jgi:CRISPR-associated exonuclease Cas4
VYTEDELIPLSALQHFVVCPRQCALIHLEDTWIESQRTAEGRVQHERADRGGSDVRDGVRRAYGVPLRSLVLGVAGRADVVEFHPDPAGGPERPFPVESKRGRPKIGDEDRVQLCAQAMCLEEMLGVAVPTGALFYGERRRRTDVTFDTALRRRTAEAAAAVHVLFSERRTPSPPVEAPCHGCSLLPACRPDVTRSGRQSVSAWIADRLDSEKGEDEP